MAVEKILVVEDSAVTLKLIELHLLKEGYSVITAASGLEAVDRMYEHTPDLIISDIMMNDMDGFSLLQKIRAERWWAGIPFIFLSAKSSIEDKLMGFKLGGDDYITKPFQVEELVARIRVNLGKVAKLKRDTSTDYLTGALNRRALENRLAMEIHRSQRFNRVFSVAMLDIDHFKKLNDTCGHLAGDEVLRGVTQAIQEAVRDIDVVARYGGEEFVVIMPETGKDSAFSAMERLKVSISEMVMGQACGQPLKTRVSIGISEFPADGCDAEEIIKSADSALYQSKNAGRDRVTLFSRPKNQFN
ncbi:MAG: diguanylate cyclase [Nitrospinae bacterium]|nr:diguanylate cyclase [Nitrospinota bacterium]